MRTSGPRLLLVLAAGGAAFLPVPASWVEQWYSRAFYPRLQSIVTPASNLVPFALFDVLGITIVVAVLLAFLRRRRAGGVLHATRRTLGTLVLLAAGIYLVFLLMWGMNYRRVPLEQKVAFDDDRITVDAAVGLARSAIAALNAGYAEAHASGAAAVPLERAFDEAQRALGVSGTTVLGVPKRSALAWYFRRAAIDGMTDPFFLEIILNPDVLPFERPFVLAHEWAHLAGFADESEANFVAFLACVRGDALARYAAWLTAYGHVVNGLPRDMRRALPALDQGPRGDLRAIAERYARSSARVRRTAHVVYDRYLRANRVEEGIASYDAVVRLLLGSRFDANWTPRLKGFR